MNAPKEIIPQRILFCRVFPAIGVTGLAITIILNFVALLVFKKDAAEFLSRGWWSTWFPSYSVWVTFLIMSLAGVVRKKK